MGKQMAPRILAFSVFELNDMKRILSNGRKRLSSRGLAALMAVLFFLSLNISSLKAQSNDFQVGVRGGIGMATLNGYQNNGLRLGLAAGVCANYHFTTTTSVIAEFNYSMGGQQTEKWLTGNSDELKEYSKFSFHYLNMPVLYQYYFPDILGIEAGLNFRYCMSGVLKTKIGNESWHKADFTSDNYNHFDFGLIFGVYTENLIPHDNFFVSLRAYFGFLDVVKEVGSNKNVSIQVSVGYLILR